MRGTGYVSIMAFSTVLASCTSMQPIPAPMPAVQPPPVVISPPELKTILLCQKYSLAMQECELRLRGETEPLEFRQQFRACMVGYHFDEKPPACSSARETSWLGPDESADGKGTVAALPAR